MFWCETNNVDYILGLAKNERLKKEIAEELQQAKELYEQTGQAARVYKDFEYQTLDSWSKARRVIGKAEYMEKGANPRFVVTSLSSEEFDAKTLYEQQYCARGDMENRLGICAVFVCNRHSVVFSECQGCYFNAWGRLASFVLATVDHFYYLFYDVFVEALVC